MISGWGSRQTGGGKIERKEDINVYREIDREIGRER